MYAVIRTGGKQYRVEPGQRLTVERLGVEAGNELELAPILVVDGATVLSTPAQLTGTSVKARVVEEKKGPKIHGFTYKAKSNQRRRWGHRQRLSVIEVTGIAAETKRSAGRTAGSAERSRPEEAAKAETATKTATKTGS